MTYVNFKNKNWNYAGDKGTWARTEGKTVTIKKAARGLISDAYTSELREYCAQYGIDFDSIRCGDTLTITIND